MAPSSAPTRRARLAVEPLEDRTTPTFLTRPTGQINVNGVTRPAGGLSIAAGDLFPDRLLNLFGRVENEYVTGTGPGTAPMVMIWGQSGNLRGAFSPFPGLTGGINVAVGDVLGDADNEIIVAAATNGPPVVGVFNAQGQMLSAFIAFDPFYTGGLSVAVGNVLGGVGGGGYGDGTFKQEIIIGSATFSSRVWVTDGFGNVQRDFFAYDPLYFGGVNVAAGNLDTTRDPGFGFLPGQSDNSSYDEIVVSTATQASGIRVYSTWEGGVNMEQSFFAFPGARSGTTIGVGSSDGLRGGEIYASLIGTPVVRAIDGETQEVLAEAQVFPPDYSRVINFALARFTPGGYDPSPDATAAGSFSFNSLDLVAVAGDGPFAQQPRFFFGGFITPAPANGP